MSQKQSTSSSSSNTLNYDPSSLQNYQSLTGSGSGVLNGYMNNPFGNPAYQMGLGQSQKSATAMGNNAQQALQQNMKVSGMGGQAGNAFQQAMTLKQGRANLANRAQASTQNVQGALGRQMQATGMGMSFNPLMTGSSGTSNSTQTTGGLGSWLPQLLGAGAGAFMSGGMSLLGGATKGLSNSAGSMTPGGVPQFGS